MKKVVYKAFGGLDVLELMDANVPAVGPRQVLVRLKAAAINPVDWKMREGQVKFLTGWRMPQGQGLEFSGVIEQVGHRLLRTQSVTRSSARRKTALRSSWSPRRGRLRESRLAFPSRWPQPFPWWARQRRASSTAL